jgi:hypothetical protein
VTITDEDVALISPLAYAHVIPNGTYFFDHVGEADTSTLGSTCREDAKDAEPQVVTVGVCTTAAANPT